MAETHLVYVFPDAHFDFWAEQLHAAHYRPTGDIDAFSRAREPRLILWSVLDNIVAADVPTDVLQTAVREKTAIFAGLSHLCGEGVPFIEILPGAAGVTLPNGVELMLPQRGLGREGPAAQALALYLSGPPGVGASAFWPPALFTFDQRGAESRQHPNEMELTGRARHLVFGPYLSLPPGRWRATVTFRCDEIGAAQWLRLEWGGLETFVTYDLTPGKAGRYEAVVEAELGAPQQVECRVILIASALEGWFAFDGAEVEKLA